MMLNTDSEMNVLLRFILLSHYDIPYKQLQEQRIFLCLAFWKLETLIIFRSCQRGSLYSVKGRSFPEYRLITIQLAGCKRDQINLHVNQFKRLVRSEIRL